MGEAVGGERRKEGRGWEDRPCSECEWTAGPREQEVPRAKPLTGKLLSKQSWPAPWTPLAIVPGADPSLQSPKSLLHSPPHAIQTRSSFHYGLQGGMRSSGCVRKAPRCLPPSQNPPSLTRDQRRGPGPFPGAEGAGTVLSKHSCLLSAARLLPASSPLYCFICFKRM